LSTCLAPPFSSRWCISPNSQYSARYAHISSNAMLQMILNNVRLLLNMQSINF
jgi:hypothetical protein